MRLPVFLPLCLFSGAALFGADPFVGTWVHNEAKSPKPTIKFAIKDLGNDQVSLTGSTGKSVTLKTDGVPAKTSSGATLSLKKLDDRHWEEQRADPDKMKRTLSVSADDQTMTLVDVYTFTDGNGRKDITTYTRLTAGKGLFGEWQSFSLTSQTLRDEQKFVIAPYGKDGLSFIEPDQDRLDMNFDGKPYTEKGPNVAKNSTTSGKRVTDHLLKTEEQVDGKLDERNEYRLSDDGKTLTIVSRPANSDAVFTSVFDKR